jgi:DNA polymerase-1
LQVHDELIFEVMENEIESLKELVRREMSSAANLLVSLDVNIGVGPSWDEAAH